MRKSNLFGWTLFEFYLKFWHLLNKHLLEVFNESLQCGSMPDSLTEIIIRLIFKKKGDVRNLKNWKPISLLNTDYKILAKVLANRLGKVLPSIIHPNQTCSVKSRLIFDNLNLIREHCFLDCLRVRDLSFRVQEAIWEWFRYKSPENISSCLSLP